MPKQAKATSRTIKRTEAQPLSPEKQKIARKIHEWAHTKDPEASERLFREIWAIKQGKIRPF